MEYQSIEEIEAEREFMIVKAKTEAAKAKEEADLALTKAKMEAAALSSKKAKERQLAIANAELNAFSLVEDEVKMLPNDDNSVGKQSYLQQYVESQNEIIAQANANQQGDNAMPHVMPHEHVTFHDLNEPTSYSRNNEVMTDEVDRQIVSKSQTVNLNPTAQSFVPPPSIYNNNSNVRQIPQTSSHSAGSVAFPLPNYKWGLPPMEISTFNGEPMEFPIWIKKFETQIEARTSNGGERLAYLDKYTTGKAKDAIKMMMHLNSNADYEQAKDILWKRFGNASIIADAYTKRLMNWPPILQHNGPALSAFSDFLRCCVETSDRDKREPVRQCLWVGSKDQIGGGKRSELATATTTRGIITRRTEQLQPSHK